MDEVRFDPASVVFEGRILVAGGYSDGIDSDTVEKYDHVANTWTYLPCMKLGISRHRLVAMSNKLYVFGGREETCEVFYSSNNSFSLLKAPPPFVSMGGYNVKGAVSIGNKILIFRKKYYKIRCL